MKVVAPHSPEHSRPLASVQDGIFPHRDNLLGKMDEFLLDVLLKNRRNLTDYGHFVLAYNFVTGQTIDKILTFLRETTRQAQPSSVPFDQNYTDQILTYFALEMAEAFYFWGYANLDDENKFYGNLYRPILHQANKNYDEETINTIYRRADPNAVEHLLEVLYRDVQRNFVTDKALNVLKLRVDATVDGLLGFASSRYRNTLFPADPNLVEIVASSFPDRMCKTMVVVDVVRRRWGLLPSDDCLGTLTTITPVLVTFKAPKQAHSSVLVFYPETKEMKLFDPSYPGKGVEVLPYFARDMGYEFSIPNITPEECVQRFNAYEGKSDKLCLWYSFLFALRIICGMDYDSAAESMLYEGILDEVRDLMLAVKLHHLLQLGDQVDENLLLSTKWCERITATLGQTKAQYKREPVSGRSSPDSGRTSPYF